MRRLLARIRARRIIRRTERAAAMRRHPAGKKR